MISASAGSGKTWQLSNRYIALLVLGVKPERVIALTFTRKAAGEFSDRILTRLAEGASSESNAQNLERELLAAIHGTGGLPGIVSNAIELPVMSVSFFQSLLEQVVSSIDRLALSTLDSFFVKLLRGFAFELGMSGFELLEGFDLEVERLRVFADIFQTHSVFHPKELNAFVTAFTQSNAGSEGIKMRDGLQEFIQAHQYRWLRYPNSEQWGNEKTLWPEGLPWPSGENYKSKSNEGLQILEEVQFADSRYKKGVTKLFELFSTRDGKAGTPFKGNALFNRLVGNLDALREGSYMEVSYKKEIRIEGELAEVIYDLLGGFIGDEIQAKLKKTEGVYEVVKAYEELYNRSVRSQGKLGFSDATLLLAGGESTGLFDEASFDLVQYRFDGLYDHWMLDEFQDTSRSQWNVISNLIDEVVYHTGGDRSLFVVGDKKQGIFGWRGGEPKLFDQLSSRYGNQLLLGSMDASYRSSQSVLDLVNKVCDPMSEGMKLFPSESLSRWQFHEHAAAKSIEGHSWVCEMDYAKGHDKDAVKKEWIGAIVEKLNPVRRGISCAILVRKNSRAGEIAEYLREYHPGIAVAVEDENLVAEENPVTAVLVDAFRFLCYPCDTLAWMHIMMSPFAAIFTRNIDNQSLNERNKQRLQVWHFWNKKLCDLGIEKVLLEWVTSLKGAVCLSSYTLSKLVELESAASRFTQRGGGLSDWLSILEQWSQKEVTRDGVVQIMTTHKAKGLGFDAVILPDLDDDVYDGQSRLKILEVDAEGETTGHVLIPPTKEIRQADPVLSAQAEEWSQDQCYEQFCVLYVMLTRAVHATYCLLDGNTDNPDSRKRNSADWIRESVAGANVVDASMESLEGRVICEYGSWEWLDKLSISKGVELDKKVEPLLPKAIARQKAVIASKHGKTNFASIVMDSKGMEYGSMVHSCFESIEWWDGTLEWQGDESVRNAVLECMQETSILAYFSFKKGLKVYREQTIEVVVDDVWTSGVVDRLIISYDEKGNVEHIAVVDFKTDTVDDSEQLISLYEEQICRYRSMLTALYALDKSCIYGVIISTHLKKACAL